MQISISPSSGHWDVCVHSRMEKFIVEGKLNRHQGYNLNSLIFYDNENRNNLKHKWRLVIGGGLGKELSFAHDLCFSPLSCWQWSPSGSQFLLCSYVLDPPLNPPPVQVIASCWYTGNACSSWSENIYKIKWGWVRLPMFKRSLCVW